MSWHLQLPMMQMGQLMKGFNFRAPPGLASEPEAAPLPVNPLTLIWCHERCHKNENQARRDAFQSSATLTGAQALLCKKTKQFSHWLERSTGEERYVLITDWREAQPCMQVIAKSLADSTPHASMEMVIVLCESEKQGIRAIEWRQSLDPQQGSVHVYQRDSLPATLLDGLVKHVFTEACAMHSISLDLGSTSYESYDSLSHSYDSGTDPSGHRSPSSEQRGGHDPQGKNQGRAMEDFLRHRYAAEQAEKRLTPEEKDMLQQKFAQEALIRSRSPAGRTTVEEVMDDLDEYQKSKRWTKMNSAKPFRKAHEDQINDIMRGTTNLTPFVPEASSSSETPPLSNVIHFNLNEVIKNSVGSPVSGDSSSSSTWNRPWGQPGQRPLLSGRLSL